ncbi:MAG TPA: hypothetical protein VFS12_09455 [Terriglobia bacterium]|nr:hypothetical protein [Terriglobia bacterium]
MKADKNQDGKISPEEFPDPAFRGTVLAIDRVYGNKDGSVDAAEWNQALRSYRNQSPASHIKWRVTRLLSDVPSVLLYESVLYLVKKGGIATTLKPETGEILKQGRLKDALDSYYASPVAADGKVFFVSEAGKVAVVKAGGTDWQVMAVNDLGEQCYATPALADGRIYIRTRSSLCSFGTTR